MQVQGAMLVGVTGAAGSGKDTLAEVLIEDHGYQRVSWADALYLEVAEAFDVDESFLRRRATKELPSILLVPARCHDSQFKAVMRKHLAQNAGMHCFSPRKVMQLWGTDYRRATDDSYWMRQVFDYLQSEVKRGRTKFVIPDCRFDNEAILVRANGGVMVHIERPGIAKVSAHASEVPVTRQPQEAVLINDGTLEEFHAKVQHWSDQLP